jgi:hypothetical protein
LRRSTGETGRGSTVAGPIGGIRRFDLRFGLPSLPPTPTPRTLRLRPGR